MPITEQSQLVTTLETNTEKVDAQIYLKVMLTKSFTTIFIPITEVIKFTLVESQDDLLYHGELTFHDQRGIITQKLNLTAQEEIVIEFGGNEDNRTRVEGIVYDITMADKNKGDILVTLTYAHKAVVNVSKANSRSYSGPLHNVVIEIAQECEINTAVTTTPTTNSRNGDDYWINPGFKYSDYLSYLKSIAVSTDSRAAYVMFCTRDKFMFVPKDFFNKKPVIRPDREYTDVYNKDEISYRRNIMAHIFHPINEWLEHVGISKRYSVGSKYITHDKMFTDIDIDSVIAAKTFLGKCIFLPSKNSKMYSVYEYTGFRDQADLDGYTLNKSEIMIENLCTASIQVPGDVTLQPGDPVHLYIETPDPIDMPSENFYSGKWIINKVVHTIQPGIGYICVMDIYRNAVSDITDELLIKRASNVNDT
jgi:hypothetical protein